MEPFLLKMRSAHFLPSSSHFKSTTGARYKIEAMAYPLAKPATVCFILSEALGLPKKNPKLISSLFLISFLLGYLLFCIFELSTYSLLAEIATISASLVTISPTSPAFSRVLATLQHDTKALLAVELVFVIISVVVGYILNTIIVYALAATHSGKLLALKELLGEVKSVLRRAVLTQFLLGLLNGGYVTLLVVAVGLLAYVANGSIFWLGLLVMLAVAGVGWYFYLLSLFWLSMVVAVMEEDHCGVRAISRATELISGSKWRATLITTIAIVVASPIAGAYSIAGKHLNLEGQIGAGFIYVLVLQAVSFLVLGAIVVFYYECKKNRGEGSTDMVGKIGYSSVHSREVDGV